MQRSFDHYKYIINHFMFNNFNKSTLYQDVKYCICRIFHYKSTKLKATTPEFPDPQNSPLNIHIYWSIP